ncbi:MAG: helix-turn-helix domain-containing protein [Cyclobacteriaceae bacterium]
MTVKVLLAGFSAIIILNSIFFGLVLIFNSKGLLKNRLLGFLLFGIALRTGKSILMLLIPHLPDSVPAIGLIGMGAIGPLFYFYTLNLRGHQWSRQNLVHFAFSMATGLTLPFASDQLVFWLYFFSALQMATYVSITSRLIFQNRQLDDETFRWLRLLTVSISLIWAVYAIQLFYQQLWVYLTGTVIASLSLFAMLYVGLQSNRIFTKTKKLQKREIYDDVKLMIEDMMSNRKMFTDGSLTLSKFAHALKIKPYVLSGVLNDHYGQSFPEFVNSYRIREAQVMLRSEKHQMYSIEAIAYDCGFNTPSAFYTSFKKVTKLTPAEYRDKKMAEVVRG